MMQVIASNEIVRLRKVMAVSFHSENSAHDCRQATKHVAIKKEKVGL